MPSTASEHSWWHGRTAALGTMHKKELIIAPLLAETLGVTVITPPNFDSDQFGTFTGEIARRGTQLEAARAKAHAAIETSGCSIGIGSEGSFAAHPHLPFLTQNIELVVLIDSTHNLEVIGHFAHTSPIAKHASVRTPAAALETAKAWGFPRQGVILRRRKNSMRNLEKELCDEAALLACTTRLLASPFIQSLWLETDMRAHRNPSRQSAIADATRSLIEHCCSYCPRCAAPGYVIVSSEGGLPCAACHTPTDQLRTHTFRCQLCQLNETRPASAHKAADPGNCPHCNP